MSLDLVGCAALPGASPAYPERLRPSGGGDPVPLAAYGATGLLRLPLLAVFSSIELPGEAALAPYDLARALREAGTPVIGGFQSPPERDCLDFLLRGTQPLVICPARSIEGMRAPAGWRQPLEEGRLLVLSEAPPTRRRASASAAQSRNRLVADLAHRILVIHATPGGRLSRLAQEALRAGKRLMCLDIPPNHDLLVLGAHPVDPGRMSCPEVVG